MLIASPCSVSSLITKKRTLHPLDLRKNSLKFILRFVYKSVFISVEQKILFVYHNYLSPLGDGG